MPANIVKGLSFFLLLTLGFSSEIVAQNEPIFKRFNAYPQPNFVLLEWEILEGSQCFDIAIERSVDSVQFERKFILPGFCGGNTVYSFIDSTPVPFLKVFYRLVSAGSDRSEIVSPEHRFLGNSKVFVYPNPIKEMGQIVFQREKPGECFLKIYNSSGALLREINEKNKNVFDFNRGNLSPGIYFFTIKNAEGLSIPGKFMVLD